MRKSAPQPATMSTPMGGKNSVMITMRIAGAVSEAIIEDIWF